MNFKKSFCDVIVLDTRQDLSIQTEAIVSFRRIFKRIHEVLLLSKYRLSPTARYIIQKLRLFHADLEHSFVYSAESGLEGNTNTLPLKQGLGLELLNNYKFLLSAHCLLMFLNICLQSVLPL